MSIYEKYTRLYHAMMERYRARIYEADPRVGLQGAFHHAHNWGNDAARELPTRGTVASSAKLPTMPRSRLGPNQWRDPSRTSASETTTISTHE